jgi:hypothetical protein
MASRGESTIDDGRLLLENSAEHLFAFLSSFVRSKIDHRSTRRRFAGDLFGQLGNLQICTNFMTRTDLQKISKKFVPSPRSIDNHEYQ